MKVPERYYDEIFDFNGQWDVPSKCGLKLLPKDGKTYIVATELYQDNPGTSVTSAGYSLFRQICERKGLNQEATVYIECNPDTNSKLSFYDEEFFEVSFDSLNESGRPIYRQIPVDEIKNLII
jgi:hypothetical protein